ncbi:MAG: class II aldolase/adducin family protein [Bacteroidales bacterium]|nr:class II aldolase/adducin family protein [Bacteroidales bacterium]
MNPKLMPPREQITEIISRIYHRGLTTTSGGNISIRDENGDVWVTPAGIDKGSLRPADILCVHPDGSVSGPHKPSSELPFHLAIYKARPDLNAIVHAHPPALVSFSIVRDFPNTNVIPQAREVCGPIGYAKYELPGSQALGEKIAEQFILGFNSVILENHGTVVGGVNLQDAFQRFETFDFVARILINARTLGTPNYLTDDQIMAFEAQYGDSIPEMDQVEYPSDERELRSDICRIVRRACDQGLMISTYGTVSTRWRGDDFLITPRNFSRWDIEPQDVVQIRNGKREPGKTPSRSILIHQEIYRRNPAVKAIIFTQAPFSMAFGVTGQSFDNRTIPESWILLQDVPLLPFGAHFAGQERISQSLRTDHPVLIIRNDSILVTGNNLLHAFDRLEVAEFSARSLIQSIPLGTMKPIDEFQIEDLRKKFLSD